VAQNLSSRQSCQDILAVSLCLLFMTLSQVLWSVLVSAAAVLPFHDRKQGLTPRHPDRQINRQAFKPVVQPVRDEVRRSGGADSDVRPLIRAIRGPVLLPLSVPANDANNVNESTRGAVLG